jgi:hypothetical protein
VPVVTVTDLDPASRGPGNRAARPQKFVRPSAGATIAIVLVTLFGFALVAWLYPVGLPYLADLGVCGDLCQSQAESSARTRGILSVAPFVVAGWLLYGLGSSPRVVRSGAWVVLLGAYATFFPVIYWATR